MGSNMAECHPVAFRWVMQAKTRTDNPATIIHADPRFTRTSAMANIYAPLRAGSDIVFLGALINYVLDTTSRSSRKDESDLTPRERFFHDYLVHYTNAATLITEEFKDTEEDRVQRPVLRLRRREAAVRLRRSGATTRSRPADKPRRPEGKPGEGRPHSFTAQVGKLVGPPPKTDPTLQHPHCVFQILKRHYQRYTPEMVEEVCGTPRETFLEVAETLCNSAGPDRTGAICYAVGWTQHTVGVQMIRAAAVLQLLLGNIGRPGGGILALRGHATIQGSTDIATLYNLLPGYLPRPRRPAHRTTRLRDYIDTETSADVATGRTSRSSSSASSRPGSATPPRPTTTYAYDYLPKNVGDHSHMPMFVEMAQGQDQGLLRDGPEPGRRRPERRRSSGRRSPSSTGWWCATCTRPRRPASGKIRRKSRTARSSRRRSAPRCSSCRRRPSRRWTAASPTRSGWCNGTSKAPIRLATPAPTSGSPYHLGRRLKELYKDSKEKRDRPIQALVWDYIDEKENDDWKVKDEPSAG